MHVQAEGARGLVMTVGNDLVIAPLQELIHPAVAFAGRPEDRSRSGHPVHELQSGPLFALDRDRIPSELRDRKNGLLASPGGEIGFAQDGR